MSASQLSVNIRYLLWKSKFLPDTWEIQLSRYLNCDEEFARKILLGKVLINKDEVSLLSSKLGYSDEMLLFAKLVQDEVPNILLQNLNYVFDSLDRGMKKVLAANLQVHPTTISRWCAGENQPTEQNLEALKGFLGINQSVDLRSFPLFLSLSPTNDLARRQWLHRRLDKLDKDELAKLFPALEKLLG